MGKAINSIVNRSEEGQDSKNVVKLECLDFNEKTGSRVRAVIKNNNKNPHTKLVTAIREVKYLYDNEKVSYGTEIVEEISLPVGVSLTTRGPNIGPEVVERVVRDLRTKVENGQ